METMETTNAPREVRARGPRGHWIFGSLLDRRSRPLELFTEGVKEYGKVVLFRMGPTQVFLLNKPQDVQAVLGDQAKKFVKGFGYHTLEILLGKGLLNSEGEFWRRQRKLVQPVFHRARLVEFARVMEKQSSRLAELLQNSPHVDVCAAMTQLTLGIVGETLFGADVSADSARVSALLSEMLVDANKRMLSLVPLPLALPTLTNFRTKKRVAELDHILFQMIEQRRAKPDANANDLLSLLMGSTDEEAGVSSKMSDKQLRDEAMTLFVAGHETTANALAWTLILLAQHPRIQDGVFEELSHETAAARSTAASNDVFERAMRLPYLGRVLDESLRLYPPAWVISRQSTEPVEVAGQRIQPKDIIVMSPWVLHHDADLWENPEEFDPDRFLPERMEGKHKYAYLPFGGGPRVCIGRDFAKVELLIVLSTLLRRYRVALKANQSIAPHPLITLRPRGKVEMEFISRSAC